MSNLPSEDRRVAICQALNDVEEHIAAQEGIPEFLRPVLVQAEANCRSNRGDVMSVATIDDGRRLVTVPNDVQKESLFHFLWDAMVASDGKSVQFAYTGEDGTLRVIYMTADEEGYVASATIERTDAGVRVGDWRIKKMERS
jgi:hypothetical protein